MRHLFAALIFNLEKIHFETFLHLTRLFLGRYFFCTESWDLRHKRDIIPHSTTYNYGDTWRKLED